MKQRTQFVGVKVREHEHKMLTREAIRRDLGTVSNLVRTALDQFLGSKLADGNLSYDQHRRRVSCPGCGQKTRRVYGPAGLCGRCYRQANPEKFANAHRPAAPRDQGRN